MMCRGKEHLAPGLFLSSRSYKSVDLNNTFTDRSLEEYNDTVGSIYVPVIHAS